jgi:hypothetical protein
VEDEKSINVNAAAEFLQMPLKMKRQKQAKCNMHTLPPNKTSSKTNKFIFSHACLSHGSGILVAKEA